MINNYKQYLMRNARGLLVMMMGFFAFMASGQSFTIDAVSTPANGGSYYPYEEIDVTYSSDYSWPTGTVFYLVLDVDGDGEYSDGDHMLDSQTSTNGTLTGNLPNDPDTYDLLVVAGNSGSVGSDSELSDNQITVGTLTLSGTDEFAYNLSFDFASTDRSITSASADYDDGDNYTLFVSLDADSVTSSNPVTLEYIVGDDTTSMSDIEGDSEFTAVNDTLVFKLPEGALTTGVRFRLSQQGGDTLAADTLEWIVSELRIQSNDDSFIRYGVVNNGGFTIASPTIITSNDTVSTYVGELVEFDYDAYGFTTNATIYLYSGDLYDPTDRYIIASTTDTSGTLSGSWPYDDDADLYLAGVYGNTDTPIYDYEATDLTATGSTSTGFSMYFGASGVRSVRTPAEDLSGESYVTLEVGASSDGNTFTSDNGLMVQYSTNGSTWTSIDTLTGNFNTTYTYEVSGGMISSSTQFRVRQVSTSEGSGSNDWWLTNIDVIQYREDFNSNYVFAPANPTNYSIEVLSILDDNDDAITEAFPGDEITILAKTYGFDAEADSADFAVVIDDLFVLENANVSVTAATDSLVITGTIPANVTYDVGLDVEVKLYDGSTAIIGLDVDVFDDYDAEDEDSEISFDGGEYDDVDMSVTFTEAGDRWLTTPAISIPTTDGLTMEFTLERVNGVRSPSGTEVRLEYSTDNGTTYTTLADFSINAAGTSGTTYTLDSDTLVSGVVSTGTMFRFRQLSNNGLDLDSWELSDIQFMNGTNILEYTYVDYDGMSLDVNEPIITLDAFDAGTDYYPGMDLEVTFSIEGSFPTNTEFSLLLDEDYVMYNLGDFSAAGTHTVKVPAKVADIYDVYIQADFREVESGTAALTINEVQITNISVTSSESTTDGTYEFIYPSNEITVSYETVGFINDDVLAYLEVWDNNEDEYVTLEDSVTVGDDITTTLPLGLDYSGEPSFRLTLMDMSGVRTFVVDNNTWSSNETLSSEYFPLDDRVAHNNNNYFYNPSGQTGERSATSIPLDFSYGGRVDFDMQIASTGWYIGDQDIYLQYSTDKGETWVEFATGTITNAYVDLFGSEEIPEEAWMDSVLVRFIYNEDEFATYAENYVYFYGFDVEYTDYEPVAQEEFDLGDVSDLNLELLSISLATLDDTEFNLGEEFTVEYNVDGPFGDDVDFAVVMNETVSGEYMVLGESDATGAVQLTVSAPQLGFGDDDPTYEIAVYPFVKESDTDTYRAATETEDLTEDDDFVAISGRNSGQSGYTGTITFDETGERYLTTRELDLADFGAITLNFDFTFSGLEGTTLVLPILEASTDGSTFTAIPVTDATYEEDGLVYPGGSYSVEIDEMYQTETTSFRWRQPINGGEDAHVWTLNNISVDKGESNVFNPASYTTTGMDQEVTLNEPNLDDYIWAQADSSVAVYNGDTFDYVWMVDTDAIDESHFPAGTSYTFSIDIVDPDTDEYLVLGTADDFGTFEATIPSWVPNATYDVMIAAEFTVDDEVYEFDFDDNVVAQLDVFVRALQTNFLFDENETFYAGNSATFSVTLENDDTDGSTSVDLSAYYANLLVKDFDSGEDLILATQLGDADITVDLPPYLRGTYDFQIEFTEDAPLGEVGELTSSADLSDIASQDGFTNGDLYWEIITAEIDEQTIRDLGTDVDIEGRVYHYGSNSFGYFRMQYSLDGGETWTNAINFGTSYYNYYSLDYDIDGLFATATEDDETIMFRWALDGNYNDGNSIFVNYINLNGSSSDLYSIDDNTEYFPNGPSLFATGVVFENNSGRGLITTRDFEAGELENSTLISFDVMFDEIPENLASDQYLVFEYSIDGGASYTEIVSLPESDEEEPLNATYLVELEDDMKTNTTRFRFRQEERDDIDVSIKNFSFIQGNIVPFDYISASRTITNQQLLITGFAADEVCYGDDITINYEVRGKFGEDNLVEVTAEGDASGSVSFDDLFSVVDGTGSITLSLPSDIMDEGDDNDWFRFTLDYDDETNEDYDYSGSGVVSELSVEVIAPIEQDLSFSFDDPLECSPEDVVVTISNPQDYFMYEVLNTEDNSVLGSLTYDPETGDNEVNIGTLSEDVDITVRVTSMSSTGLTCNTRTQDDIETVEVQATYKLFRRGYNNTGVRLLVNDGDSRTICGSSYEVRLSVNRDAESSDASTSIVEWFRDDLSTPVSISGSILGDNETLLTGDYFARVTETSGDIVCEYITESFSVTAVETPDRPVATVVSGDLTFCEGEGEVVLSGPDGFEYYQWNYGQTTQQITVDAAGSYTVRVSNVPFDIGCASSYSEAIVVESSDLIDFKVQSASSTSDQYAISEGQALQGCESKYIYFYGDNSTSFAGIVKIYKDGVEYASTTGSGYSITESGEYYAEWISDDLNATCTAESPTFTVEILTQPDTPSILASGALEFCEGGSVTLTATTGHTYYRWYRNGTLLNSNSETLTVTQNSGRYQVEVADVPFSVGCTSDLSKGVEVTVYNEPTLTLNSNYYGNFSGGEIFEICSSSSDDLYLRSYNSASYPVVWYLDGAPIEASEVQPSTSSLYTYVYPTASGQYHFETTIGNSANACTFVSEPVNVVYNEQPAAVTIATPATTSFCDGETEVTLEADAGFTNYRWYFNGSPLTDGTGTSNTLTVNRAGEYTVTVANEAGCESEISNRIIIEEIALPSTSINIFEYDSDCSTGDLIIGVNNTNSEFDYQLTLRETGEPFGPVFTGSTSDTIYVTLSGLTTYTQFGVEVSYADGTGCTNSVEYVDAVEPDFVVLDLSGNTITADISGDYIDYTWYRNDVELRNVTGTTLTVTDAATYSIEVVFEGGCTMTSNAVALTSAGRVSNPVDGKVVANTYPNPTTNIVNLDIPGDDMGEYKVQIMTLSGQIIMSETFNKETEQFTQSFNISTLKAGIYNMTVVKGDNVENIRIVKQ